MTLKARTATTVIPAGCPMHASNVSNNEQQHYGGYTKDTSQPIKIIKAKGQPLSGDEKKDWVMSQDKLAARRKERVILGIKTAGALAGAYIFIWGSLQVSKWLYYVDPELLE